jgi:ABC-2 type transport system permease protein
MRGSLSAELLKLRKRPAVWVISAVFVVLSLLSYGIPYLRYRSGRATGGFGSPDQLVQNVLPEHLMPSALGAWPLLGGAVVLVLGTLVTGSEYGWRTLKTVLSQRSSRYAVLGGKLAATALVTAILVVVSLAADALAALGVAAAEKRTVHWPPLSVLTRDLVAGWLIVLMWSVLGMFLGIALRGTALPIGAGLVWILVVEQIVRGWIAPAVNVVDFLQRWLPGTNAGSLVAALGVKTEEQGQGHPGVNDAVGSAQAWLVIAVYVIALAAGSAALLRRRDVT